MSGPLPTKAYVLTNFNTTFDQDVERVQKLKELDVNPYIMIYDKYNLPTAHPLRRLQGYVNNRYIFWSENCKSFEDYI